MTTEINNELSCTSVSPYAFMACTGTVLPSLRATVYGACKKTQNFLVFYEVDILQYFI